MFKCLGIHFQKILLEKWLLSFQLCTFMSWWLNHSFLTLAPPLSSSMAPSMVRHLHLYFFVTANNSGPHLHFLQLKTSPLPNFIQDVFLGGGGGAMFHCMTCINYSNSHCVRHQENNIEQEKTIPPSLMNVNF